jgi:cytochrome c oxidase subunit 1
MTATLPPVQIEAPDVVQRRWSKYQLYLSFVGLFLGLLMGFLQAFDRLGYDLYSAFQLESYWQGLTLHGVALAIVFTFTFANGFLTITTMRGLERPMASTGLVKTSFWLAIVGVALAASAILLNKATVLFTFYSPMEAAEPFYIGAALLVVSTWVTLANQIWTYILWRQDNPDERIPLLAYVSIMTFIMWVIASIGIAVEVLGFILPWSFGWMSGTDPLLNRTLFWFSGHPIVYFWLLPAYVSWYMMVPKQVGGKLWSAGVVKAVFILFLLLSTPVGLHHQFTDPGVDAGLKWVHAVLTFGVFFPSMVTAFTIVAALENGARARGGKGLLMWIRKLPWGNASVVGQLLAMIGFALGGASGLVNASATVNQVVHNTSYVPGHFHLTVGTAVALTIMAVSYWLIPHLTGKKLWGPKVALTQVWLWFGGVLLFSNGQMTAGLQGQPRRLQTTGAEFLESSWEWHNIQTGIGGTIMFISGLLFFTVLLRTLLNKEREEVEMPIAETIVGLEGNPAILDRLGLWTVVSVVLIAIAYVPVFLFTDFDFSSPGFRLF